MLLKIAIEIVEMLLAQYNEEWKSLENETEISKREKTLTHMSADRARFALKELKHIADYQKDIEILKS